MDDKQNLKLEIQSQLEKLHDLELKEVADFVSFLISKNLNKQSSRKSSSENFDLSSWLGCLSNSDLSLDILEKELKQAWRLESSNNEKKTN